MAVTTPPRAPLPKDPEQQRAVEQRRREVRQEAARSVARSLGRTLLTALSTVLIVVVIWVAVLLIGDVSPYVSKNPLQVFEWLVTDEDAAENRAGIFGLLGTTMVNSAVGFVSGLLVAIVVAVLFRLSRGIESALMPFALLLRSVPLVAMAPLIILVFGNGTLSSVAVIGGIVVLFPALVNIVFGLRSASPQMLDVVTVYGGSTWTQIRKVALPAALPSLFAAIRISVPGAITGALLAEWLSTGDGIGGAINGWLSQAKFNEVWASVVVVTGISLILYMVAQVLETLVLSRMAMGNEH